jgi:hypothetical protein
MRNRSIPADEIMKSIQNVRESDLSVYDCPLCKSSNAWIYDGETSYVLTRLTGKAKVDGDKIQHEVAAQNSDGLVRADCSNCGFVALFKRGLGPA